MSITFLVDGGYLNAQLYLEDSQTQVGYTEGPSAYLAVFGSQNEQIITQGHLTATQVRNEIDFQRLLSAQVEQFISRDHVLGSQSQFFVTPSTVLGSEIQLQITVEDLLASQNQQFITLDVPLGTQDEQYITKDFNLATQIQYQIRAETLLGTEVEQYITRDIPLGSEVEQYITRDIALPSQGLLEITVNNFLASQNEQYITFDSILASQVELVRVLALPSQVRYALYNIQRTRFLCEFPSRGISGTNWTATSEEPGDFSINNVNNDIVEFYWRTATGTTSATITCDTELPQGVFNDTTALLNHNLTRGAQVTMQGSNDAGFVTVGFEETITWTERDLFYIAPELPKESFRYWRFNFADPSNPDGFIRIGTIVFGASNVFQGECATDQIVYGRRQFVDQVFTEGHTNVQNDRGQKRYLTLDFQSLNAGLRNYRLLQELFEEYGVTHKCLWIVVPTDPSRFAVFAKLNQLPQQTHNWKGEDYDLVDLTLELDESL